MNNIYVVKADGNSWFIGNTFAILIDDYRPKMNSGLFWGTKMCDNPGGEGKPYGQIYFDEEVCSFDEFEEKPVGEE